MERSTGRAAPHRASREKIEVTGTKAELRARAEALAAEYDAPLPDVRDFRAGEKALYRDFRITIEAEGIVNPIIEPVRLRLWGLH